MSYNPNPNNNPNPQPNANYSPHPPFPPYPGAAFTGPPAQPLPLGEAIKQLPAQYLRVLTRPGDATFVQEKSKAAWNIIWFQIALITIWSVGIALVVYSLFVALFFVMMHIPDTTVSISNVFIAPLILIGFALLIAPPTGIFIMVGLYYLIAKAFKGQGTFLEYMYSYLLFYIPLTIISGLIALLPFVGPLVSTVSFVYMIILQIYMTMAVHRMSGGRATLAVLLLSIILIIVLICGVVGILIAFAINTPHVRG